MNSAHKLLLSIFALVGFMSITLLASPTDAFAEQRTCCKANTDGTASGDCNGCNPEGWETKNYGDSCNGAAQCIECPATHPKSNVCGSKPDPGVFGCTVGRILVRDASGATNYGPYGYGSNLYACAAANSAKGLITRIAASSANKSVLTYSANRFAPEGGYLAGDTLYCISNPAMGTIVGAGTAAINLAVYGRRCPACAEELMCKGTTGAVTGTGPLACVPGSGCKPVSGATPTYGGNMVCNMPTISKPAEHSSKTLKYYVKCDVYNGTKLVKSSAVNLNSTTPAFPQFKLSYRGTYKCSFRHCFETSAQKYCSAWGAVN